MHRNYLDDDDGAIGSAWDVTRKYCSAAHTKAKPETAYNAYGIGTLDKIGFVIRWGDELVKIT